SNQQTLNWDKEGNIESIVEGGTTTSFVYDADGKRLIRKTASGSTLYLPDGTEVALATGASTATATRYYSHKNTVIAVRTIAGLNWIIGDHQGTAGLTINASTLAVAKRRTMPFGDVRVNPGAWPAPMDKGFVGGTKDPTGLTHLGARLYDPALGRFVSVDPVIDAKDPQQLNAYAYGNNNPVTNSDPNGEFWGALKKAASAVASAASTAGNFVAKVATSTVESIREDPLKFAVGLAVGIAAVAAVAAVCATGVGCVILAGAVAGAAAAGAEYGVDVGQGDREFSVGDLGKEMAIGGLIGGATAGLGVGAKKLAQGARRALSGGAKAADDIAEDAAAAGRQAKEPESGGSCPVPWLSFDPATPVLLASGLSKPIGQIQLGDEVKATDPVSGLSYTEPVIALYGSQDVQLADVSIVDATGDIGTIHTTQNHPFWSATQREWVQAAHLQPGEDLRTADGSTVQVSAVYTFTSSKQMLNLGIEKVRTYYVIVNGVPVLVHNMPADGGGPPPRRAPTQVIQAPKVQSLPGFPGSRKVRGRTPIQGGGGTRARWETKKNILEWDSQHGEIEMYNKRGVHLGSFDPDTGKPITDSKGNVKGPNPGRKCVTG
ncbi:colicin E3/pyocin S6 family cytotoxin, partial [Micromonosporaceae bacterium Da 78-11]